MLKGYLYKQSGSGLKPFQKRYFVFEKDRISYYVAPNKSKKGEIFISKMIGASLNPSSKKKHCFVVECKDRRYTFLAESNEEAQTWVSEINKILLDVHHIPVNAIAEKVEDYKVICISHDDGVFVVKSSTNEETGKNCSILSVSNKYFKNVDSALPFLQPILNGNCGYYINQKFITTANDSLNIYFEHISNDNIFHLVQTQGKLETYLATLYAAEIFLVMESLAERDCCFAFLPLYHCQLDPDGHVKIISIDIVNCQNDNRIMENNNKILVEYAAPEIVKRIGFSTEANWWNLGILIYEMLQSVPPFYGETLDEIIHNILEANVTFPQDNNLFTPYAKDLITKLLEKDPAKRLSNPQEIRNHRFFSVIDWNKLENRQIHSIYIPQPGERSFEFDPTRKIIKTVYQTK